MPTKSGLRLTDEYEELGLDAQLLEALRVNLGDARSVRTLRAYKTDCARFHLWRESVGAASGPPDSKLVALYLFACAIGHQSVGGKAVALGTLERRYVALKQKMEEKGFPIERTKFLKEVLANVRLKEPKKSSVPPPVPKPQTQLDALDLPVIKRFTKKRVQKILDVSVKVKQQKPLGTKEDLGGLAVNLTKALGL
jgi:hypothetical protein